VAECARASGAADDEIQLAAVLAVADDVRALVVQHLDEERELQDQQRFGHRAGGGGLADRDK